MTLLGKNIATKVCHVCELEKPLGSFIYFKGSPPKAVESTVCSGCNRELRQVDSYCNKVLEGVFIPSHEKPILKSSLHPT